MLFKYNVRSNFCSSSIFFPTKGNRKFFPRYFFELLTYFLSYCVFSARYDGPNPDVKSKGCIGQVRRSKRGQNITLTESGGALPPLEDTSRRVPTAYLFLHLNFIILFRRYGAPVRFLRSYIHDTNQHVRHQGPGEQSSVNNTENSFFRGQFCERSGALIRTR